MKKQPTEDTMKKLVQLVELLIEMEKKQNRELFTNCELVNKVNIVGELPKQ